MMRLTCWVGAVLVLGCGPAEHAKANGASGSAGASSSTGGADSAGGTSNAGDATDAGGSTNAGGSTDAGGSTNAGGGSAVGGTQAEGGDSSAAGDGGAASNAEGAQGTVQFGRLLHIPTMTFEASASFYAKGAVLAYDCQSETFGDCSLSSCVKHTGAPTPNPYAGSIEISDGKQVEVTLDTTPGMTYLSPTTTTFSVSGGENISATASGGAVPAFTAQVAVPRGVLINSPALDQNGSATVPRNVDLVLGFNNRAADGESGTQLKVQAFGGVGTSQLDCNLPTESGKATIPSAVLSKLSAGSKLLIVTTRTKHVQAGAFDVRVIAYISATNANQSAAAIITLK